MNLNWQSAERNLIMYSQKYVSYIKAYKELMGSIETHPKVIVEIGIANGGSLELWRRVFGDEVRIIGIDLNPNSKKLESHGYEVLIADMGKPESWLKLQHLLGGEKVDFLIDDGGHTNPQQILAISRGLPLLAPGGILFIEDFHSAFMADFGNPSKYSSWNFLLKLVEDFQRSHFKVLDSVKYPDLVDQIESFHTYLSLVAIKKRSDLSHLDGTVDLGTDKSLMDFDHRWDDLEGRRNLAGSAIRALLRIDNLTKGIFRIRGTLAKRQSRAVYKKELHSSPKKHSESIYD